MCHSSRDADLKSGSFGEFLKIFSRSQITFVHVT